MSATLSKGYLIARCTHTVLHYLHLEHWIMAGLMAAIAIANLVSHRIDLIGTTSSTAPVLSASVNDRATSQFADAARGASLTAPMRTALDYVSRRYLVSAQALVPIFETAEAAARERHIDPMLLIAVISIESRFNPYSQSVVGAQGLMQIIPRFYLDKVPKGSGDMPFLDPVTNIRIGAEILQETIRQHGGLMAGLQYYGGAADDEEQTYANKVMAEKQRLDQVAGRGPRVGSSS